MKEIKNIVKTYDSIDWTTTKAALATVVRVEGSSYRRTGARMLVLDNGNWIGGISGGCLEGDALKRAKVAIYKAEPTLITYDTTTDDEHQIGVGLGCNGIIDVLFCPINPNDSQNSIEILKNCLQNNRNTNVIISITEVFGDFEQIKIGQSIPFENKNSLIVFGESANVIYEIIENQVEIGHSSPKKYVNESGFYINYFIEIIPPEIHLVLFGHQYDVFSLAKLVNELGWRITIVAPPLKINNKLKVLVNDVIAPENYKNIILDDFTAIILMAHDYNTDKANLGKALQTKVKYIGLLGPKVRSERMFQEIENEGIILKENDFDRIFAPIGLDIGAVTPEEITLSLVAEVRAVFSNRKGESLRLRKSPIHERNL